MSNYYIIVDGKAEEVASLKEYVKWNNETKKNQAFFTKEFQLFDKIISTKFYGVPQPDRLNTPCFETQFWENGYFIKLLGESKEWNEILSIHKEWVNRLKSYEKLGYDFMDVINGY